VSGFADSFVRVTRWLRCAACLVIVLGAASGCSVKMMYNNMDRISRWVVSDYIDMTPEQRAYFDAEMAGFLYWHRTTHLPQYAAWLESMEPTFTNGTSTEEFEVFMGSLFDWYEEAEARGMPIAIEMMLSLTDEQLARLPVRLEEDNEELAEDEAGLSVEQSQKRWREEFADGFARFAGKLNREQKDYLVQQSVRYVPQYDLWADYRRRWYLDVMALLRDGRNDPEAFAQAFIELAANRRSHYYGLELTVIFDHNEVLYRDVSVWLINHLSEKQREKLFTRTGELAEVFRELVAQAPEQAPTESACLVRC
jgi:hypothetical protein